MFAYIDETGNTGENLFDPDQPVFITSALMTKCDFDFLYGPKIKRIADIVGADVIHANELGVNKLEKIAIDLLSLFKKADARIFIARVVKLDLAVMKLVDTLFDSGENIAVPWLSYNAKPLRFLLIFKVAYLLNEEIIKLFWSCLMDKNKGRAYKMLRQVLEGLLPKVNSLPDERSREIIFQALKWAIENPEAIHLYSSTRFFRYGHLPNMVVFPELLRGIEKKSREWRRPVIAIIHDRQSQFGSTLTEWHNLQSQAAPGGIRLLFEDERIEIKCVAGSKFVISSAQESPGIQMIDVVLWLFKRIHDGEVLPENCSKLMRHALRMGGFYDLSLESIGGYLRELMSQLEQALLSEDQMKKAQELLKLDEQRRQERMREYHESKLLTSAASSKVEGSI